MPVSMTETLEHLQNIAKLVTPIITPLLALGAYTWKKQDKSIDALHDALKDHVKADDDIHDDLYDKTRETGEKLATLIGEHKAIHRHDGNHKKEN
jgi:hypothetical protein